MKSMSDAREIVEKQIKKENELFQKYMAHNPDDKRRAHDHDTILATLTELLHEMH